MTKLNRSLTCEKDAAYAPVRTDRQRLSQCPTTLILLAVMSLCVLPAAANASDLTVCDEVAHHVAAESGVPVAVLQAITRTETGRMRDGKFGPWPWTVNMEGKGVWFDTLDEAKSYVFKNFKRGARSFDVGCFQINYKWHGEKFDSIDEMFEPLANARYAADFLNRLYAESGDWKQAAGAFHSKTPKYANKYKAIFAKHYDRLNKSPVHAKSYVAKVEPNETPAPPRKKQPRPNRFLLLQAGAKPGALGSLVPLGRGVGSLVSIKPNSEG